MQVDIEALANVLRFSNKYKQKTIMVIGNNKKIEYNLGKTIWV